MKLRYKLPRNELAHFPDDIERMRQILSARGYEADDRDIAAAWMHYSNDQYCAGWLILHKDDEAVFEGLMYSLEEVK